MSRAISTLAAAAVFASALGTAGGALADRALVIGASEEQRRGIWRSGAGPDTAQALRDAGFEVITADASEVAAMRAALSEFYDGLAEEERIVLHLSGSFLRGAGRNWLVEAGRKAQPDLASIDDIGLSLETVLAIAGQVPGAAVVALGSADGEVEPGPGLRKGHSGLDIPQGGQPGDRPRRGGRGVRCRPRCSKKASRSPPPSRAKATCAARGFLSERVDFLPAGEERPRRHAQCRRGRARDLAGDPGPGQRQCL